MHAKKGNLTERGNCHLKTTKGKLSYTAILNSDLHHISAINEFDVIENETSHGNEIEQEMD